MDRARHPPMGGVRPACSRLHGARGGPRRSPSRAGVTGVLVSLDGSLLAEAALAGHRFSPVSITLAGAVHGTEGQLPPPIGRIDIDFGSNAEPRKPTGLPACRRSQLVASDLPHAMEVCGPALVGKGSVDRDPRIPRRDPARSASSPARLQRPQQRARRRRLGAGLALQTGAGDLLRPALLPTGQFPPAVPSAIGSGRPSTTTRPRFWRLSQVQRHARAPTTEPKASGAATSTPAARCRRRFSSLSIPLARATYRFAPTPDGLGQHLSRLPGRATDRPDPPYLQKSARAFRLSCSVQAGGGSTRENEGRFQGRTQDHA